MSGQQGGTRWRTGWSNMVIGQLRRLGSELVDVRSLDYGIARESEITVTLVVSDDENDVWPYAGLGRQAVGEAECCGDQTVCESGKRTGARPK